MLYEQSPYQMPDLGGGHKIKYNTSSSKLGSDGFNAWPINRESSSKILGWTEHKKIQKPKKLSCLINYFLTQLVCLFSVRCRG